MKQLSNEKQYAIRREMHLQYEHMSNNTSVSK